MSEVGAYEAKTHLPKLLERVEKGERFTITKHGRPVAELVPISRHDAQAVHRTIATMRSLRAELGSRGVRLSDLTQEGVTVRNLAHEGHRY